MGTLAPLEDLVSDLEALNDIHATVHYSPSAWVELVIEDQLIRPGILRQIADHGCGIVDLASVDGQILVVHVEVVD